MSDISFNCLHCGQHLVVDEAGTGMNVNCPSCNSTLHVPNPKAGKNVSLNSNVVSSSALLPRKAIIGASIGVVLVLLIYIVTIKTKREPTLGATPIVSLPQKNQSLTAAPGTTQPQMVDEQYWEYLKTKFDEAAEPAQRLQFMTLYLHAYPSGKHMGEATALLETTEAQAQSVETVPHPKQNPVGEMKALVSHLTAFYNADHRRDQRGSQSRIRNAVYDVQQTGSLVTPFSGYIDYEQVEYVGGSPKTVVEDKIELAYQNDKWVVKRVQFRLVAPESSGWKYYQSEDSINETVEDLGLR